MRAPAARSGGAAGVSHDSPRAQTCTFEGPGLQKHHQNSTKKTKREGEKNENCGGRGKKKSKILGGPAEGGPAEGGPAEGGPAEGGPAEGGSEGGPAEGGSGGEALNTPTTHTQHNNNNNTTTTQHNNNTAHNNTESHNTQHTTQQHNNTTTQQQQQQQQQQHLKISPKHYNKIGQSRFGQSRSRPRLAKVGRKIGQNRFGQSRFGQSRP